ncbi:hypothetical protein C4B63_303g15 [Trypanosoma cruzi]|uniref:Uncharacterized protein n=1 Tax=Trypanosoma cruzi TaxID=5693 RepID=A0A2V2UJC2_TRYCR|nr:hypothetical protein C4B63_303g15 [Trypanosoma cruzi]
MFPDKYRRVPALLKPQQGGQQFFNQFLIRFTNDRLMRRDVEDGEDKKESEMLRSSRRWIGNACQLAALRMLYGRRCIGWWRGMRVQHQRVFNERIWYEEEERRRLQTGADAAVPTEDAGGAKEHDIPPRVLGNDYFQSRFGYSLVKQSEMPQGVTDYNQLDMWGRCQSTHVTWFFFT